MQPEPSPRYRRPDALLAFTCVGLGLFALLDSMNIPVGLMGIAGAGGFGGERDQDLIELSTFIRGLSAIGQLALFLFTPAVFSMLVYRCAKNARALGFAHFNHTPGWCVGWFFIPFAHLIMPYKANAETWKTSRTPVTGDHAHEWSLTPVGPLFNAWWLTWIFGTIANNVASRMSRSNSLEAAGMWLTPFAAVLQVASAALAILVVARLVKNQHLQASELARTAPKI